MPVMAVCVAINIFTEVEADFKCELNSTMMVEEEKRGKEREKREPEEGDFVF